MIKLPEPVAMGMEEIDYNTFEARYGYTEAQLLQALRDFGEQCAQVCDARNIGDNNREDMEARKCATAIRALIKEIE